MQTDQVPFPFIWLDVALVNLLSALPLALALATFLRCRISAFPLAVLAALVLAATVWLFVLTSSDDVAFLPLSLLAAGYVLRALLSLGAATAAALGIAALIRSPRCAQPKSSAAMFLFGSIVLFLLPTTYIHARCRHDAGRIAGLLEQSRLGEALVLTQRLLVLTPRAEWNGTPLRHLAAELNDAVREIKARVATLPSLQATDQDRLARARDLAILGHTPDALAVLASSASLAASPDANNFRGAIYEARGEWESGRESYGRAKAAWQEQPPSAETTAGLIRATTGIAYCQRKLGKYREAELAYLDLLNLSPTANSHFLLARFYDDTDETIQAHAHARQAMRLDPSRYQVEGQRLLDNLATRHFGCLTIFQSDRYRQSPLSTNAAQ